MEFFIQNCWVVPLAPLIGFLINGLGSFLNLGYVKSRTFVHVVACGALLVAFAFALGIFWELTQFGAEERVHTVMLYPWLELANLKANIAFLIDPLSSLMMLIITGIGFLIHVYSTGYMHEDKSFARFFTYLNLFCFAMLLLVMGDNIFMLFVGWEGVGLCSYLLIGFWFDHKPNAVAGMKAFIVNRVGDFGFLIGVFLLFWYMQPFGYASVTFLDIQEHVHVLEHIKVAGIPVLVLSGIMMFVGATGKSAQIPLYVWLPDAMAGPTPVSALIHAATMVTAGIYMIARMNFVYALAPEALVVVATVGAFTALFAATIGFAQNDIKKVLAYSTVSQLGYMFLGMGAAAYAGASAFSAGMFHVMTHAFFKACLFLGSGSVILGMHHEQDMRRMGGLRKYMPTTYWTFLLATIAIAGIFPFAGFFSKDEILWKVFSNGSKNAWFYVLWVMGILGAMGTAFYMFRAVSMTFFGKLGARTHEIPAAEANHLEEEPDAHGHGHHTPHESPKSMTFALVVLALLSVVGGFFGVPYALGFFVSDHPNLFENWLHPVLAHGKAAEHHEIHAIEYALMAFSVCVAGAAIYAAWVMYNKRQDLPKAFVQRFPRLYRLVLNKYYVDEIYQKAIVSPLLYLNQILALFDQKIIDGFVNFCGTAVRMASKVFGFIDRDFVDGLVRFTGSSVRFAGARLRQVQTGLVQNYLYVAAAGVMVLMLWKLFE